MFETPVLLLVFNRPNETKRVFEAIRKRAPKHLYIAADGPRPDKPGEKQLCEAVLQIVQSVDWECEVKTLFREQNAGCKKAVSGAIDWFFSEVERGIILEDDCLPDQTFFIFCEQLLEKYKDEEKIISIGGTNLGYKFNGDQSFAFSRFMNMWGWATWRRSARLVDYNMTGWKGTWFKKLFLYRKLQDDKFKLDYNWIKFWDNYFTLTAYGLMDTWDYQWIYTQMCYDKVSIFPAENLIQNIGFSNNATHTFHPDHPIGKLELSKMYFPLREPLYKSNDILYENNFIKKIWFNYQKESLYYIMRSNFLNIPFVTNTISFFTKKKNCVR
jgi:hypothetical protein